MIFSKTAIKIDGHSATLDSFIPNVTNGFLGNGSRPAVIILPGGGYAGLADHEADPIALKFCSEGVPAFVLYYAVKTDGKIFPVALAQALTAVKYVRERSEEFGIDPNNIATLGFSAGGHLCATTGTLWNSPVLDKYLDGDRNAYRPDKMILCYPVISAGSTPHIGSFENLTGKSFDSLTDDEKLLLSTEKQVGSHTPPAFIWSTAEDTGVPPLNSIVMAKTLTENHIPFELHIYPHGYHGLSLGTHVTTPATFGNNYGCADWSDKAIAFMFDKFEVK